MAAKNTLNAKNLEKLGVQQLAELLIEISTGSAANKRKLRIALAGSNGSKDVANEVRKRFASIQRSRTIINWRKVKAVKLDLETQRSTINGTVAVDDADEALDLMWQFLGLSQSIFERTDDNSGTIMSIFREACTDAGRIAQTAQMDAPVLAARIFGALRHNIFGQYDTLIREMAPALGDEGLKDLRTLLINSVRETQENDGEAASYANRKDLWVSKALQDIADAQGDVDAYIAQKSDVARKTPHVAAQIAVRLLAAGRARDALSALEQVNKRHADTDFDWQQAYVETLEELDRGKEAQEKRWRYFQQTLNESHLRSFLKRLPDFDDIEAEENAFAFVQKLPDVNRALAFFILWPSPGEAAKLVIRRYPELDGDLYDLLTAAAEMLKEKHPLAATMVLRSMIDFSLERNRSGRYKHAARHMMDLEMLARHINEFDEVTSHDLYVAGLRRKHGKKHGFWAKVR